MPASAFPDIPTEDCYVFYGNPAVANGMRYIGDTRGTKSADTPYGIATGRLDRFGPLPLVNSIHFVPAQAIVTVPFAFITAEAETQMNPGAVYKESGGKVAVGYRTDVYKVPRDEVRTLAMLPKRATAAYPANLADDPDMFWVPAALATQIGEFKWVPIMDETGSLYDDLVREVTLASYRVDTDLEDTAIPSDCQNVFRGSATAAGLASWTAGFPNAAGLAARLNEGVPIPA